MENTKKYKIELSENEILKLTIFILQYEDKVIETSRIYKDLCEENKIHSEKQIKIFKDNSEYYKEMYCTIKEIRYKLDNIPF